MVVDHVVMLVADAADAAKELRARHGLGCEQAMYYERAGTRHYTVPLEPPAYLEFLTIENRTAARGTELGRRVLAHEAAGRAVFAWAVLVDDLEAVSKRLGVEIFDYTAPHGDGTLRGWRAVSGPAHLPFFIDYPNNGDRSSRLRAMYDRVGHTSAPKGFTELTIAGSEREHLEWLGPNDLPLRFVSGDTGIRSARVATAAGDVVVA